MALINRCAVSVKPLQPMLDWLRPFASDSEREQLRGDFSLYLIDAYSDEAQALQRLQAASGRIFEEELELWCRDRQLWPSDRSPMAFQGWFEVRFHHLVEDLGLEPLDQLQLDPDLPELVRQAWAAEPPSGPNPDAGAAPPTIK